MNKKQVLLIHTGGTIAMSEHEEGGVAPSHTHPLYDMKHTLTSLASIDDCELFQLPSPHITPQHMVKLAQQVKEKLSMGRYDGVVITHGTDTLEETAYVLDLLVNTDIPIVLTGAMRSSNEPGADGPHNLLCAVRTAICEESRKKGVLVVFNDEIHTARNVTKSHATNVATFQSPQYGPIGIITKHRIIYHHEPLQHECYPASRLNQHVLLLKTYAGMEESLFHHIVSQPLDGLVIEALGQGNIPPSILHPLEGVLSREIPVVLVSRCFAGIVQDTYRYTGGGQDLKEKGVIFTNGLNGPKARLKLMTILDVTTDHEEIRERFKS